MRKFTYKITTAFLVFITLIAGSLTVAAQNFNPSSLGGLTLWLRSDTGISLNGTAVTQWQDISGNNNHCAQGNSTLQPVYLDTVASINNYPAVSFDGSNDVLNGVTLPHLGDSTVSIFIVADGNAQTSGNNGFFATGSTINASTIWIYRRPSSNGFAAINSTDAAIIINGSLPNAGFPYKVLTFYKKPSITDSLYVNGGLGGMAHGSQATAFTTSNSYTIGRAGATLNGSIAEVLVYTQSLTYTQRKQVENYLFDRYAPPVNLGPDITNTYSLCADTLNAGSRFISYAWSTGDNTSTAVIRTNGTYSVTVTDMFGRSSSDTIQVTFPNTKLNIPDTTICAGSSVTISTLLTYPNQYLYQWQNAQTSANISATQADNYYALITDTFNCSVYSDTVNLNTDNFSASVSLGPDADKCSGNTISLQSPATDWSSLQFLWSDNSMDSILTVNASGNYSVTVTNNRGCIGIDTIYITLLGAGPIVNFMADTFCLGTIYNPQNTSISGDTSTIQGYDWDFGDNSAGSSQQNPLYLYQTAGTYTVSLTASTLSGCNNTASKVVVVHGLPIANYTSQPIGCINNAYNFTDQSSPASGTTIQQWQWNFGDNSTSIAQSPAHVYTTSGGYSPQLIVTDNFTCADTVAYNISVISSGVLPASAGLILPANNIYKPVGNVPLAGTVHKAQLSMLW